MCCYLLDMTKCTRNSCRMRLLNEVVKTKLIPENVTFSSISQNDYNGEFILHSTVTKVFKSRD
jgi:hypothetical protein